MSLISSSADKSIIIWKPEKHGETWVNKERFGEIGGTTLGFYGALFSPDGNMIVSNGYHGSLEFWKKISDEKWVACFGTSGHQAPVEDLSWDPSGQFLLTTSLDQTTRLYSEWKGNKYTTWHAMARPQVHGYDLHTLAFTSKYEFVSGADEKVVRVFEAPRSFVEYLGSVSNQNESLELLNARPAGASLPSLGLSNKAIESKDIITNNSFAPLPETHLESEYFINGIPKPPLESTLLESTLWPEKDKLYGHNYEIISISASQDGDYIATSCKASLREHASVFIWSSKTCKLVIKLTGHGLTVTGTRFSWNDEYLLSVSRDRGWHLYKRVKNDDHEPFAPLLSNTNAHARIIWDCSWTHDSKFFCTASRDKSIKIWSPKETVEKFIIKFEESVTTCDFAPSDKDKEGTYTLALGLSNGKIQIIHLIMESNEFKLVSRVELTANESHTSSVKRIRWRRGSFTNGNQFASCSEDHSLKITTVL